MIDIGDVEEAPAPVVTAPVATQQATLGPTVIPVSGFDMMGWLRRCFGRGLLQVFGDSKVGKTKMVLEIAKRLKRQGYRVKYIDTERNLDDQQVAESGVEYVFCNSVDALNRAVSKLNYPVPEQWDLVIVDSVTIFITDTWGEGNMNQHGKLLQDLQVIVGKLKNYAIDRNCVGIVIFQPTSRMTGKPLAPLGDKTDFQIKNQLYMRGSLNNQGHFQDRSLEVFHCRRYEDGMHISNVTITNDGVKFDNEDKMAAMR